MNMTKIKGDGKYFDVAPDPEPEPDPDPDPDPEGGGN